MYLFMTQSVSGKVEMSIGRLKLGSREGSRRGSQSDDEGRHKGECTITVTADVILPLT